VKPQFTGIQVVSKGKRSRESTPHSTKDDSFENHIDNSQFTLDTSTEENQVFETNQTLAVCKEYGSAILRSLKK
jgi:hypothetical protein